MNPLLLLSSAYENGAIVLKFYDTEKHQIITWYDSEYKPYFYTKIPKDTVTEIIGERDDVLSIDEVEKIDLIKDEIINITKITCAEPISINGSYSYRSISTFLEGWETDIRHNEAYLYDHGYVVGKYYKITNDKIEPYDFETNVNVPDTSSSMVDKEEFKEYVKNWAKLLNQPIPELKRMSVDIEVESEIGNLPDPNLAEKKVTAIGMESTDGLKIVLVLQREGIGVGSRENMEKDVKLIFFDYDKEKQMLEYAFSIMGKYPLILTFNGDQFDLPYLYNRAQKLGIDTTSIFTKLRDSVTMRVGVHIDLFRVFSNKAYQIYTFNNKYNDYSLNSISLGLLGEEKIKNNDEISVLTDFDLAHYCYNDARLTLKLTTFDNSVLMNILIMTCRVAKMPIDAVSKMRVSQWVKSLLYFEHRKKNILIPRRIELDLRTVKPKEDSLIDGKKFKGAFVLEPKVGAHFNVTTLDFASLYPSIMKTWNVSYETIRCSHEECMTNLIPLTDHWSCGKRNGVMAMAIGSLRDLRVNYYKSLLKTSSGREKEFYDVISQTLKVFMNACFSGDTDVMTPQGVRNIKDIKIGDVVYTLNPNTFNVEEAKVIDTQEYVSEDIISFKSKNIDWLITDEHRMYLKKNNDDYKWFTANNVSGRNKLPSSKKQNSTYYNKTISLWSYLPDDTQIYVYGGSNKNKTFKKYGFKYTKATKRHMTTKKQVDELQFLKKTDYNIRIGNGRRMDSEYVFDLENLVKLCGWYISEGNLSKTGYRITITQDFLKNKTNVNDIVEIIQALGYEAHLDGNKSISFSSLPIYYFLKNECGVGSFNKKIPQFLFDHIDLLEILYDMMYRGDGHKNQKRYSTVSKQLCNDIQKFFLLRGVGCNVYQEGNIFRIVERKQDVTFDNRHIKKMSWGNYVYCVTTEKNHIIMAGRNGKMNWVGQSYGITGFANFPLFFLPAAETVTAVGRATIMDTINECQKNGIEVLYSDTDSVFCKGITSEKIQNVIKQTYEKSGIDLEVDKEYRYVVLSNRKKNYFGVKKNGSFDIKGLTSKKSHTPQFAKKLFSQIKEDLLTVQKEEDFIAVKDKICKNMATTFTRLKNREMPLEDLAFNIVLSRDIAEYTKNTPQHVKAALQLKKDVKKGDIISYVKVLGKNNVKPVNQVKKDEIDIDKYVEFMQSTMEQIIEPMNLDFAEAVGLGKQVSIEQFF